MGKISTPFLCFIDIVAIDEAFFHKVYVSFLHWDLSGKIEFFLSH